MNAIVSLLKTPLFILKWHQRRAFEKYAPNLRGRVLDIGCGWQPYRGLLACDRYLGLEVSADVHPDVQGSASQVPFRDGIFDGIVCTEVIEHMPDPQAVFDEIGRVLKRNGVAYLTAPMSWCRHYGPCDYFRFTNWGLELLARRAHLRVVSSQRLGGVFSLVGVRLADVIGQGITFFFRFMGPRGRERLAAIVAELISIPFWLLGLLFDRFDDRDAIGWAVLMKKADNESRN